MSERTFIDKGHYFILLEGPSRVPVYNPESDMLDPGEIVQWAKTHVIVQRSCMKAPTGADFGMQFLRFHGVESDGDIRWELASNPYAGVYLTNEEWAKVTQALVRNTN